MRQLFWAWLVCCVGSGWHIPSVAMGQENAAATSVSTAARYLPNEAIGTISMWPAKTSQLPRFRLAPLEVATAAGLEQVGIDPLKVQRLDIMFAFPGPAGPQFGAVVQMDAPVNLAGLNPQLFGGGMQNDKGFEFMRLAGTPGMEVIVHPAAPNVLLIGTQVFVKRMAVARQQAAPLAATLVAAAESQDVLAMLSISAIRPVLEGALESLQGQVPPPIVENLTSLVKNADFLALRLTLDKTEKLQLMASAVDDQAAIAMEKSLLNLVQFFSSVATEQIKAGLPKDGSQTTAAMQSYLDRVSAQVAGLIAPRRSGKRVVIEFEGIENAATIGTLVGLLLPAVQASREAARRMSSSNNLKQLGLALHNYHDTYRAFPATAITDKASGKPLLSWRVAVLPYIEEIDLYNQFHLDEPWDSPHNITLLEKMPATYKHPGRNTQPGHTVYQAPVSEQTLLRKDGPTKMAQITDGTSNTIMLVEVSETAAVPWTAPDDLPVDSTDPLKNLISPLSPQVFQALFGDGSVRAISANINGNMLNALFTRSGGEVTTE